MYYEWHKTDYTGHTILCRQTAPEHATFAEALAIARAISKEYEYCEVAIKDDDGETIITITEAIK